MFMPIICQKSRSLLMSSFDHMLLIMKILTVAFHKIFNLFHTMIKISIITQYKLYNQIPTTSVFWRHLCQSYPRLERVIGTLYGCYKKCINHHLSKFVSILQISPCCFTSFALAKVHEVTYKLLLRPLSTCQL